MNGYFTLTHKDIVDVYNLIEDRIQKYFDDEMKIYQKIDSCQSIIDLIVIDI
jgi:hypothetical protein